MHKLCTGCHQSLPITFFNKHKQGRDGLNPQCRDCRTASQKTRRKSMEGKRATYKYLYKISIEEIELLLKKQNNNCAICGVSFLIKKSAVDHCHTTGKVRGMLCRPCNSAIGLLGENTRTLNAAIRYLKK